MKTRNNEAGFSLMELLTVVAIIGLLATLAIPNYSRMIDRSARTSCIANQRTVAQSATLYASQIGMIDGTFNVGMLLLANEINADPCQCPSSTDATPDDYTITIVGGYVSTMVCEVLPVEHEWSY